MLEHMWYVVSPSNCWKNICGTFEGSLRPRTVERGAWTRRKGPVCGERCARWTSSRSLKSRNG
eukprot:2343789-Prymnesium_polylepis.1